MAWLVELLPLNEKLSDQIPAGVVGAVQSHLMFFCHIVASSESVFLCTAPSVNKQLGL